MDFEKLRHINPSSILDIGAHIGSFARSIHFLFPQAKLTLIEANPNCELFLEETGFDFRMFCLSSGYTEAQLFIPDENSISTGVSLYKENTVHFDRSHSIPIQTAPLDDLDIQADLIKIDCQGSELDIIEGGIHTIRSAKYVIAEVSLAPYNKGAPLMDKVMSKMKSLDFIVEDVVGYHSSPNHYGGCIFQLDLLFRNEAKK